MPNEFSYKIFRQGDEIVLAISDLSILGKTFEQGELRINVSKDFYCEKECGRNDLFKLVKDATIINAVGKRVIDFMIKENIVNKETVLVIGGVPHAQVVTLKSE